MSTKCHNHNVTVNDIKRGRERFFNNVLPPNQHVQRRTALALHFD